MFKADGSACFASQYLAFIRAYGKSLLVQGSQHFISYYPNYALDVFPDCYFGKQVAKSADIRLDTEFMDINWNLSIEIVTCSHVVTGKQIRLHAYEIFMELHLYIFCVKMNMILYQARDREGKDRSDGQAGNTASFSAASIKLLQNIHQTASLEQGHPLIQLKSLSLYDSIREWLVFQTLCANPCLMARMVRVI